MKKVYLQNNYKEFMGILRWITSLLGFIFGGGILGGAIGYFAGSTLEKLLRREYDREGKQAGDFSISLMILAASVMKADNRVMRSELDYVKEFLLRQMSEEAALNKLQILKELLNRNINLNKACMEIRHALPYSAKLQLVHFLFGIAEADGDCTEAEKRLIERISVMIGLRSLDYRTIEAMYFKKEDSAYTILQIDRNASESEIKKAYRKLAIKYHPDKVASLGEDAQRAAKTKFQEINNAYELIKKERKIA